MVATQDRQGIGIALGKIPSGTAIATAWHEEDGAALLASWIQQASFEPPMITMAVKQGRPIETVMEAAGRFVVNLVGEGGNGLLKHFSRGFAPGEDPFVGLQVEQGEAGPILADGIAYLACRIVARHQAGDHHVYLAEVTSGAGQASAKPHIHVRENGFSY